MNSDQALCDLLLLLPDLATVFRYSEAVIQKEELAKACASWLIISDADSVMSLLKDTILCSLSIFWESLVRAMSPVLHQAALAAEIPVLEESDHRVFIMWKSLCCELKAVSLYPEEKKLLDALLDSKKSVNYRKRQAEIDNLLRSYEILSFVLARYHSDLLCSLCWVDPDRAKVLFGESWADDVREAHRRLRSRFKIRTRDHSPVYPLPKALDELSRFKTLWGTGCIDILNEMFGNSIRRRREGEVAVILPFVRTENMKLSNLLSGSLSVPTARCY